MPRVQRVTTRADSWLRNLGIPNSKERGTTFTQKRLPLALRGALDRCPKLRSPRRKETLVPKWIKPGTKQLAILSTTARWGRSHRALYVTQGRSAVSGREHKNHCGAAVALVGVYACRRVFLLSFPAAGCQLSASTCGVVFPFCWLVCR